ncbi:MAG: electron transport complex subunit RsxG [Ectothiorhodospiraceae bacterium]|nr:electron transport complex subunit RsxG [Ectothiorhodospiraceae bacterium]
MRQQGTAVRDILLAGGILLAFAIAGVALVTWTFQGTVERIEDNQRQALIQELQQLVPPLQYDNHLLEDTLEVEDNGLLGLNRTVTVYRARLEGEPVAVILPARAEDGYIGPITLLVGIYTDGTVAGVRVVEHSETPGLGDAIEARRSNWINQFTGRSLDDPETADWAVRRDRGAFDQITGATVTARAVVRAVRDVLLFYDQFGNELFAVQEEAETDQVGDAGEEEPPPDDASDGDDGTGDD